MQDLTEKLDAQKDEARKIVEQLQTDILEKNEKDASGKLEEARVVIEKLQQEIKEQVESKLQISREWSDKSAVQQKSFEENTNEQENKWRQKLTALEKDWNEKIEDQTRLWTEKEKKHESRWAEREADHNNSWREKLDAQESKFSQEVTKHEEAMRRNARDLEELRTELAKMEERNDLNTQHITHANTQVTELTETQVRTQTQLREAEIELAHARSQLGDMVERLKQDVERCGPPRYSFQFIYVIFVVSFARFKFFFIF